MQILDKLILWFEMRRRDEWNKWRKYMLNCRYIMTRHWTFSGFEQRTRWLALTGAITLAVFIKKYSSEVCDSSPSGSSYINFVPLTLLFDWLILCLSENSFFLTNGLLESILLMSTPSFSRHKFLCKRRGNHRQLAGQRPNEWMSEWNEWKTTKII